MFKRWISLPMNKSLFLLGPRRAGKSTLLKAQYTQHKYVTLDDLDDLDWARKDPKGFVSNLGKEFIIDEAQRAPELAIACKWAIDQKGAHAVLTGSTGINLFQSTTETLAGRIEIRQLPPSCFGEQAGERLVFREDLKYEVSKEAQRSLESFMRYGGFPEVCEQSTDEAKEQLLKNYKNTYFTKDLADLSSLENLEGLRALYQALIRGLGSRYEVSSLSKECGLSVPTTKKYLNSLLQSGLAFKLYGYHLAAAKKYISAAKTYFCDNGILTSLSHEYSQGQLVENFVVSEIEKRRKLGFFDCEELYYFESAGGREIDLILDEPKRVTVIEVKASRHISDRDLRNLLDFKLKTRKTVRKIIYYMGSEVTKEAGIELLPIWTLWRS